MRVIIPETRRNNNDQAGKESIISKWHSDCLPCRIISGCGVIGIGAYIYAQAKHRPAGIGRALIISTSLITTYIGTARLVSIYPFNEK